MSYSRGLLGTKKVQKVKSEYREKHAKESSDHNNSNQA
jgi:hypothetical protein